MYVSAAVLAKVKTNKRVGRGCGLPLANVGGREIYMQLGEVTRNWWGIRTWLDHGTLLVDIQEVRLPG